MIMQISLKGDAVPTVTPWEHSHEWQRFEGVAGAIIYLTHEQVEALGLTGKDAIYVEVFKVQR